MVDKFIFLDHTQANMGKSWFSRNKILLNSQTPWLTIPIIRRGASRQKELDVKINYASNFQKKHLGTLLHAYKKSPYFDDFYPFIKSLYKKKHEFLIDFNREYVLYVAERLGLNSETISSSEIIKKNPKIGEMHGNELILELCRFSRAEAYISGNGCLDFIQPDEFKKAGINFYFQDFEHPTYRQINTELFIPNLSSIDALFNIGFTRLKNLLACKRQKVHET